MSTATDTATFVTGRHDLRLTITPKRDEKLDALDRVLVPAAEGRSIQFEHGQFQTDDPELIEWLRKHPRCGADQQEGGFEEIGPPVTTAMSEISKASVRGDVDALYRILEAEEQAQSRPEIVQSVNAALDEIGQGGEGSEKPVVEDVTPHEEESQSTSANSNPS